MVAVWLLLQSVVPLAVFLHRRRCCGDAEPYPAPWAELLGQIEGFQCISAPDGSRSVLLLGDWLM